MEYSMIQQYIKKVLNQDITLRPVSRKILGTLPVYINTAYNFMEAILYRRNILFVIPKDIEAFSVSQTEKQLELLKDSWNVRVLCLPQVATYNRKRLIDKGMDFLIPGKQLFLPDLLIDLQESEGGGKSDSKETPILPSAQFLIIYHLIHKDAKWQLENESFKNIAAKTGYTSMSITKAIEDLKNKNIVTVSGGKEKSIKFKLERRALWEDLVNREILITPILKKVYIDALPGPDSMLVAGTSALPEYTDMNPSRQTNYAIDRKNFFEYQKAGSLINLNEYEGKYGLEVWKYNPVKLSGDICESLPAVDPLSLYLSLHKHTDERIEIALEQIVKRISW